MSFFKNNLANFLTLGNLFCGLLAIIQVFNNNMVNASYLVFLGAAFDFADGLVARALNAQSSIGKDLDSLADMVTFGVVPGFAMYKILGIYATGSYIPNIALLIPLFSAWRLAKFNNDSRQSVDFIGLPTPANAIFFMALPFLLINDTTGFAKYIITQQNLIALILCFCFLMVSEIRLFSLKIKKFSFSENLYPVILIVAANVLFFTIFYASIPIVIIMYILLSLIKYKLVK